MYKLPISWEYSLLEGGKMMNTKILDNIVLAIIIVGAVNWGLIGFFRFDLIAFLFGNMSWFSRVLYALVGISGIYLISAFGRIRSMNDA